VQSRAQLLPNITTTLQYIYTQGNGTPTGRFLANNGVHEYIAQGNVHQALSPGMFAEYRKTAAAEALRGAKAEIATRGLVVTVVQATTDTSWRSASMHRAEGGFEADHFFGISQKLQNGGEVARSDVIKAQIQNNQQQRDLQDALLAMNRNPPRSCRAALPNFDENFSVVDDLRLPDPLPSFVEVQSAATKNNPQFGSRWPPCGKTNQEVSVAWTAMLPSITLDYFLWH